MAKRPKEASFEERLGELEGVVEKLEDGDLPLEKSLELFESGMKLSEQCRRQLQEAEAKVELLVKKGGRLEPEPFEPDDGEGLA